ncbi:MAG: type IV toxin-antitoxin system AbiEi family antitoxin, partial [Candidatus Bipolaricaulota bacterium]|nr:type IV toxin-antitoxin system AbiEi family antitoxin [Candidatus Bipolaricaulota bacterium]
HLRTNAVRLYLAPSDEARTRQVLRLAPAQDGPIVICRAFATDLADERTEGGLRVAHAALVYAELMAAGDARLGEAALRLRKERLAWTL